MSSAITFYFKEIFKDENEFMTYLEEFDIVDTSTIEVQNFAKYLFKILFRKYHNSNVQYDTIDEFKCDFANILEDSFFQWKKLVEIAQKTYELSDEELIQVSTALSNAANNPNVKVDDPTKMLDYVSSQVASISKNGKLFGYVQALRQIPTKLNQKIILDCGKLFKTFVSNQIFLY